MKIVISYAREDRPVVGEVVDTLTSLGHHPWTDAGAHSGGRWWDEILARIRGCDVLLVVVSPALLASKACALERQYAFALHRHVLPVVVAPTAMSGMPSDLVQIHMLDYTRRDAAAAARLFQAIVALPPPRPLPRQLPAPPAAPLSYLNNIADQLNRLPGDLDAQHEIVTRLLTGLTSDDPEERGTAAELVRLYLRHPQRLHDPAERAQSALNRSGPAGPNPPPPNPPPAPPTARSRGVTVLAWIGGAAVLLVLLVVVLVNIGGGSGPGPLPTTAPVTPGPVTPGPGTTGPVVIPANVVEVTVLQRLASTGIVAQYAVCGGLEVTLGATTSCQVSADGATYYPVTVTVTLVDGNQVTDFVLTDG